MEKESENNQNRLFLYESMEAISQNIPVVVSDVEGTQWAKEYSKCVQYPVEDPVSCAAALEKALLSGVSPSNKEQLMEHYGINSWCQQIIDIYHQMLYNK